MVLLHGFSNTWQVWTPILPALEAHHAVLAPTAPGHHGGPPFREGEAASLAAMVEFVERQMDAEGIDRAHFVGNSMGGWLSLQLALRDRALSVVGLCPTGGLKRGNPEARSILRFFRRSEAMLPVVRPWLETIAHRPLMRTIAFRDVVAYPRRMSPSLALAALEGASECAIAGDEVAGLLDEAARGELGPIACRVRIAQASGDRILSRPGHYSRLRRLLPEVDWIMLEDVGHVPMTDDPDQVAKAILDVTVHER